MNPRVRRRLPFIATVLTSFLAPIGTTAFLTTTTTTTSHINSSSCTNNLAASSKPKTTTNHRSIMTGLGASSTSALDEEISKFCESNGHKVKSIDWAGSSDWASFRKVSLQDTDKMYFVKTSTLPAKEMFEGEALGLKAMYECSQQGGDGLVIPNVHYWGDYSGGSMLIMDYLQLGGRGSEEALGRAMAQLHLAKPNEANGNPKGAFGFNVDNTCGRTPQPNPWTEGGTTKDWIEFYKKHRMEHQIKLAGDGTCAKLWDSDIAPRLHLLFEGIDVKPSLLHGDLWR